jgi:cytochrome c-type biogenesis protein CcmH/NrfF
MRRAAAAIAMLLALTSAPAHAAAPRTSLPDVEDEVMCVSCRVPLSIAESPQADRERALIRSYVAQGLTKQQIKDRLVEQYGQNVLAEPRTNSGVGVAAYLVPIAAVVIVAVLLAMLIPRWRRRAPAPVVAAGAMAPPHATAAELQRLDEELDRNGG